MFLGSIFGATGSKKIAKMASNIDAKTDIEKTWPREYPTPIATLPAEAKEGGKGEVNLPLGGSEVRKFGGSERAKGKRGKEDGIYTLTRWVGGSADLTHF